MKTKYIFTNEANLSNVKYKKGSESDRTYKEHLRSLIKKKRLKILDIGCGSGLNTKKLLKDDHEIIGVDISPEAIKKYKKKKLRGYVADVTKGLPFKKKSFDLILCSEVIEHVVDTDVFLNEINRVLNKGGQLLLSTPNSTFWAYRVFSLLGKTLTEVQHPGHVRFFSKKSLIKSMTSSNFNIELIHSRKIFFIIPYDLYFLKYLGFQKEFRFKTKKFFWHLSFISKKFSNFWSDSLIIKSTKK